MEQVTRVTVDTVLLSIDDSLDGVPKDTFLGWACRWWGLVLGLLGGSSRGLLGGF